MCSRTLLTKVCTVSSHWFKFSFCLTFSSSSWSGVLAIVLSGKQSEFLSQPCVEVSNVDMCSNMCTEQSFSRVRIFTCNSFRNYVWTLVLQQNLCRAQFLRRFQLLKLTFLQMFIMFREPFYTKFHLIIKTCHLTLGYMNLKERE